MREIISPTIIPTPADRSSQITELGPWFHNLHLPDGTQTAPDHFLGDFPTYKWRQIAPWLPEDLTGWAVLDIGCNAGFYSIELARRGGRVVGIEPDAHYLKQAQWAVEQFGLQERVELRRMAIYDLARTNENFDLVLFMGVFYHLRYPLLGLDLAAEKTKRLMIFQTLSLPGEETFQDAFNCEIHQREILCQAGWPKMAFIENRLSGDPTNWWVPNHAGIQAMLRTCGLKVVARPGHEIYLCQGDKSIPSYALEWNRQELLSATGQTA